MKKYFQAADRRSIPNSRPLYHIRGGHNITIIVSSPNLHAPCILSAKPHDGYHCLPQLQPNPSDVTEKGKAPRYFTAPQTLHQDKNVNKPIGLQNTHLKSQQTGRPPFFFYNQQIPFYHVNYPRGTVSITPGEDKMANGNSQGKRNVICLKLFRLF